MPQKNQTDWMNAEAEVMAATSAFGMGIDKPNVRFVIHLSLPTSMLAYAQESGRAGRDGGRAWCTIFYNFYDVMNFGKIQHYDQTKSQSEKDESVRELLKVAEFCEKNTCRRFQLSSLFSTLEACNENDHLCDICCQQLTDSIVQSTDYTATAKVIIRGISDAPAKTTPKQLVEALRKTKKGIFSSSFVVLSF